MTVSGLVDEGRGVDCLYFDFSKLFDTVSHNIFIQKLWKCGLDEQTVGGGLRMGDWSSPEGCDRWLKSSWRPGHASILNPIWFSMVWMIG